VIGRHLQVLVTVLVLGLTMASACGPAPSIPVGEASDSDARVIALQDSPAPGTDALEAFNDTLYDALSPSHLLALAVQLLLLFATLIAFQRLLDRYSRSHAESLRSARRWLPAIRLGFALIAGLLIIRAVLPDHPTARAVVVAGVLIAVLWASRDVLRNAAAGAVLIARHAVEVGQYLKVGDHEGLVVSVTLRGIELQAPDGTHTFVPGLALHTHPAIHAHDQGRAGPITLCCHMPETLDMAPEAASKLCRNLALLSPRRAPGSPVIVHIEANNRSIWITATPFDHREAQALETELTGKIRQALAPKPAPNPESTPNS
jgi:hypothetical protein